MLKVVLLRIYAGFTHYCVTVLVDGFSWVFCYAFIAGFVLAIVFQCAHVVENADYPKPKDGGNMEHNWFALYQLHTTSNFASNSRLFSWFVGGSKFSG